MSLGLRLDVRQSQSLVLTPQLQQAIKLLQLSNLEIASVVDRELGENPFLGRVEAAAADRPAPVEREPALAGSPRLEPAAPRDEDGWAPPAAAGAADRRLSITRTASRTGSEIDAAPEAQLTRQATLGEHLKAQLQLVAPDRAVRAVASDLVDWLDDDGYLREADELLAAHLGVAPGLVGAARRALQSCEPSGVGGRDLADCLAAQLREQGRLDPAMQTMLQHLPLVARADFAGLQRVCRVDFDDIKDMIGEIKRLDPLPGRSFAPALPIDAIPDVLIYKVGQGWRVELNEATLPRVLVDRAYYAELTGGTLSRREREFVAERYQAASWLAKALDQRARTMLKVAEAIFERQTSFLSGGAAHLRPLVLRQIAEATGLHESTVSRATADKFVMTPRGTFPLRYFFTTAIAGTNGEETHSAEAIRQQIRRMIEGETAESVLSDDQIVSLLRSGGVAIARRTVAKYRESLGIPSSVQRRRSKALCL